MTIQFGLRRGVTTFGDVPTGLYAQCEHRHCALWQQWWQDEGYDEMPSGLERWASLRAFWRHLKRLGELDQHRCV